MAEAAASQFPDFRFFARLSEDERAQVPTEFFDCKFYPFTEAGLDPVIAIVGKQEAIVCRISEGDGARMEALAWFHDDDSRTALNSCCWALDPETGDPLLWVSGSSARQDTSARHDPTGDNEYPVTLSIRVFDVKAKALRQTLVGHGKEINDLAALPTDPTIVASASNDLTVRFWSLKPEHRKQPCVLICAGDGHREGLLTLAFHQGGQYLLTGGMDHVVKLWHIPDLDAETPGDHPRTEHYPHFSTKGVHHDVVDCVAWYGDLILSRAAQECKIVLWRIEGFAPLDPPPSRPPTDASSRTTTSAFGGSYQRLLQFDVPDTTSFYMRFSLFNQPGARPLLAIGNIKGRVFFWDLQSLEEWDGGGGTGSDSDGAVSGVNRLEAGNTAAESSRRRDGRTKRGGRRGIAHPTSKRASVVAAHDEPVLDGLAVASEDRRVTPAARKYSVDDPFRLLQCHKASPKLRAEFMARQVAWSVGGEWMVVVGAKGTVAVYGR